MESALPFCKNVVFKAATAPSTSGLQVHISLDDKAFSDKYGELSLEDFKLDKTYRASKDGVRTVILKHDGEFTQKQIPAIAAKVVAESQRVKATSLEFILPDAVCPFGFAKFAQCINIANYRFDLKKPECRKPELETVTLVHPKAEEYFKHEEFNFQYQLSVAKNLTRDYTNRRGNVAHVQFFVDKATEMAAQFKDKVELKVFHGNEALLAEGLRLIQAVGKGSSLPGALVNLKYKGDPSSDKFTAIVGKGIVFDQGGANVKTSLIEWMWIDKGGACACLGAFYGIVSLGLKVNVSCTLCLAENVVSSTSYRPSDIITSHKGLTVEVLNTDAEGRLVLADGISWAQANAKVDRLIDVATLTGAIIVSLGDSISGLFSNDDDLARCIYDCGKESYEPFWRMPLCETIAESMKGKNSDLRNISGSQWGGAIQGATFLKYFVDKDVKFAHLDIAATVKVDAQKDMFGVGATGIATGTLLNFFRKLASGNCEHCQKTCPEQAKPTA
jgi:leucyl aminopeptidase